MHLARNQVTEHNSNVAIALKLRGQLSLTPNCSPTIKSESLKKYFPKQDKISENLWWNAKPQSSHMAKRLTKTKGFGNIWPETVFDLELEDRRGWKRAAGMQSFARAPRFAHQKHKTNTPFALMHFKEPLCIEPPRPTRKTKSAMLPAKMKTTRKTKSAMLPERNDIDKELPLAPLQPRKKSFTKNSLSPKIMRPSSRITLESFVNRKLSRVVTQGRVHNQVNRTPDPYWTRSQAGHQFARVGRTGMDEPLQLDRSPSKYPSSPPKTTQAKAFRRPKVRNIEPWSTGGRRFPVLATTWKHNKSIVEKMKKRMDKIERRRELEYKREELESSQDNCSKKWTGPKGEEVSIQEDARIMRSPLSVKNIKVPEGREKRLYVFQNIHYRKPTSVVGRSVKYEAY